MGQTETSGREARMRGMVAQLEQFAARARDHVEVMRASVEESASWANPADIRWVRGALDDAIASAAEAERDLKAARATVGELFVGGVAA